MFLSEKTLSTRLSSMPVLDRFLIVFAQIIGHHPVHFGLDQVAVAVKGVFRSFKGRQEQFFDPDAVDIHYCAGNMGEGEYPIKSIT